MAGTAPQTDRTKVEQKQTAQQTETAADRLKAAGPAADPGMDASIAGARALGKAEAALKDADAKYEKLNSTPGASQTAKETAELAKAKAELEVTKAQTAYDGVSAKSPLDKKTLDAAKAAGAADHKVEVADKAAAAAKAKGPAALKAATAAANAAHADQKTAETSLGDAKKASIAEKQAAAEAAAKEARRKAEEEASRKKAEDEARAKVEAEAKARVEAEKAAKRAQRASDIADHVLVDKKGQAKSSHSDLVEAAARTALAAENATRGDHGFSYDKKALEAKKKELDGLSSDQLKAKVKEDAAKLADRYPLEDSRKLAADVTGESTSTIQKAGNKAGGIGIGLGKKIGIRIP